jgi:anti-sigma B factor antagonist
MDVEGHRSVSEEALGSNVVVTQWTEGTATVVKLAGEVDLSNIESVREMVEPVADAPSDAVVFDLAELRLIDSTGLSLLLWMAKKVPTVQVRNPPAIVQRVIDVTGLGSVLPTED